MDQAPCSTGLAPR